ncbi:A24 family peptidase [Streptomyces sp. NPDC005438]|uniref:A24 family peptidase n=1 Tax=Streptomyces sp. NPDC005438 TaxID=3156880 RepID=UPI0033AD85DA
MTLTLALGATGYGAATGALLPRAAYRLTVEPEEPWRDTCPQGHPVTGPLAGWVGLSRCPDCGTAYGSWARHTLATALLCGLLALAVGPRPELAVWLLATPLWVLLATVDWTVYRLPDTLTLPLALGTPALLGLAAPLPGSAGHWVTSLLGGLALGAAYAVLFLINPGGMGLGDVKLALSLGAALGWYGWFLVFLGGFLGLALGAVYGLGLLLTRRAGRKSSMPLGPFMILGTLLTLLLGGLAA